MIRQGVLPFRYEAEAAVSGMTALAGLPAYLELGVVCGLSDSILNPSPHAGMGGAEAGMDGHAGVDDAGAA